MKAVKAYVVSLGCPKNLVDTERMLAGLGPGLVPVEDPAGADVVLVNTCGFIQPAVEESVRTILDLGETLKVLPRKPLFAVTGCLVSRYGRELEAGLPEVDLFLPIVRPDDRPARLAEALGLDAPRDSLGRVLSTAPSYAYLKIAEGCNHKCRFCAIPSIRGELISRQPEEIVAEARMLIGQGIPEIIVVAQDVTAYGRDLEVKHGLLRLLEKLLPLEGLRRLRLMYLYPAGIAGPEGRELLHFLAGAATGSPYVPYFDIPVQHAHPDILSGMGRPFAQDPMRAIEAVRQAIPGAALRTSLIVGYPGEKPHHFKALAEFVRQARFHHLGVFPYWPEDGTPAAALPGQVGKAVKERRKDEIMAIQAEISAEIMSGYAGGEEEIVVDRAHGEWPGLHVGRTWFQAPDIDGVTYVSGPGVRPGALVRAAVTEAKTYDLVALT